MGFLPRNWWDLPSVVYFHENQWTYPDAAERRDNSYGFTNALTAIRADTCVFNSAFHREAFRQAAREQLRRLPKPNPWAELEEALDRSCIVPPLPSLRAVPLGPGGARANAPTNAHDGEPPLVVVFPHRLEPDKNPLRFICAIKAAVATGVRLRIVMTGGHPSAAREDIRAGLNDIAEITESCGRIEDHADYLRTLGNADVVVSTADHEYFGVAFAEAMAAGCTPLAPARQNYPDLLARYDPPRPVVPGGLYDSDAALIKALTGLAEHRALLRDRGVRASNREAVMHLDAGTAATQLDDAVELAIARRAEQRES